MTEKKVTELTFTRADAMLKLWDIAQWHEQKRLNPKSQITINLKARSALSAKEIRCYQAIIQGFKDEEIEIRLRDLEEKLANSILIPKTQDDTANRNKVLARRKL